MIKSRKPHLVKVAPGWWECYFCGTSYSYVVGSGATPYEAWMYAVWGETWQPNK